MSTHRQEKLAAERTQKWSKGEFKINVNPRCEYAHKGETRNGYTYGNIFAIEGQTWNVTHIPTGFKMPGYFNKLKNAKGYVEAIADLADWQSVTEDDTTALLKVKNEVMAAMKSYAI